MVSYSVALSNLKPIPSNSTLRRYLRRIDPEAFLRWWGAGLSACLPPPLRRRLGGSPPRLLVELEGDRVIFRRNEDVEAREPDEYPLQALVEGDLRDQGRALRGKARRVELCLPAQKVLSRTVALPLVAESRLQQVVGFEMDRITPFARDQIYYDVRVLDRQPSARRIRVRVNVVLRTFLDPLLERLREMGLPSDRVGVVGEADEVDLLPPERRPRERPLVRRLQWTLAVMALVLSAMAAALPLWQQRSLVQDLMRQETAARRQAESVVALRERLDESIESSRFLLQKRQASPLIVELLNELTVILPDSTWVEHLDIRGSEVQLRGKSGEASALIGLLEASPYFQGVTFRSPITADPRSGRDRFFLAARIVGETP